MIHKSPVLLVGRLVENSRTSTAFLSTRFPPAHQQVMSHPLIVSRKMQDRKSSARCLSLDTLITLLNTQTMYLPELPAAQLRLPVADKSNFSQLQRRPTHRGTRITQQLQTVALTFVSRNGSGKYPECPSTTRSISAQVYSTLKNCAVDIIQHAGVPWEWGKRFTASHQSTGNTHRIGSSSPRSSSKDYSWAGHRMSWAMALQPRSGVTAMVAQTTTDKAPAKGRSAYRVPVLLVGLPSHLLYVIRTCWHTAEDRIFMARTVLTTRMDLRTSLSALVRHVTTTIQTFRLERTTPIWKFLLKWQNPASNIRKRPRISIFRFMFRALAPPLQATTLQTVGLLNSMGHPHESTGYSVLSVALLDRNGKWPT